MDPERGPFFYALKRKKMSYIQFHDQHDELLMKNCKER